ncbi:MAG: ribonuclease H-like domain-containing protein [Nitrososphaera sp.]
MPNFYLDIETTGTDPSKDKIITIQFAELERNTALQKGNLRILKEWESNEKNILLSFISESKVADPYVFTFVPVGYNLGFEHRFLLERCKSNGLPPIRILNRPFIDLRSLGVLMNRGEFRDSGLDKITGKPHSGTIIPQWYVEKKWGEIERYVTVEADHFIRFCSWLYKELPLLLSRFKLENGFS